MEVLDPVARTVARLQAHARERYRYSGEIGRDAMGVVLNVVDDGPERNLAMKVILDDDLPSAGGLGLSDGVVPTAVRRFVRTCSPSRTFS